MRTSSGVTYLHGDHLGSTSVTTGASSTSQRYYPFGQTRGTGAVGTNYRFTGQRWQDDVKLYYYNARWYHAGLGRFVSADIIVPEPGNPQAFNRFSYCSNNPLRYTDPSGHMKTESDGPPQEPPPDYWDLTPWLVAQANHGVDLPEIQTIFWLNQAGNASSVTIPSKALAYYMWVMLVANQGRFDFKRQTEVFPGRSIVLGGYWFDYSTPGNILFGFFAAAAGFDQTETHLGASVAQTWDAVSDQGPLGSFGPGAWGDQPDDYAAIDLGYKLYREAYAPGKAVTEQAFVSLLTNYEPLTKHNWGIAAPQGQPYPYAVGRFDGPRQPWPAFLFPSFR